jgi:hypothetical protein
VNLRRLGDPRSGRRITGAMVAAVAVVSIAVPAAAATPPTRIPVIAPGTFTLSGVCPFDITETVLVSNEKTTIFSDGRTMTTGAWKVIASNASDPTKTYVDNNPGVIFVTPNADGTVTQTILGQGEVFFFPGDLGPGSPGQLLVTNGRLTETIDFSVPAIVPGSVSYQGAPPLDLCQALA